MSNVGKLRQENTEQHDNSLELLQSIDGRTNANTEGIGKIHGWTAAHEGRHERWEQKLDRHLEGEVS